jgi:hypothetical protein
MILLRSVLHSLGGLHAASAFRLLDGCGAGGNWTGPLRSWGGLVDVHVVDVDVVDVVVDVDDGRGVDARGRRFEEGVESADLRVDAGLGRRTVALFEGLVQQADRDDAAHLYSGRLCLAIQVGLQDHPEEPLSNRDARRDEDRILPFFFPDLKSPRSKKEEEGRKKAANLHHPLKNSRSEGTHLKEVGRERDPVVRRDSGGGGGSSSAGRSSSRRLQLLPPRCGSRYWLGLEGPKLIFQQL